MFNFTATPPLSLYVHIPWCVRKCPYCDFNSHEARNGIPETAYVDALLTDLERDLPRAWGRTVESIFIGGGTPSLFSPEAIDRLLSGLRARLALKPAAEITLEANPGTLEAGRFEEFRGAGINRLSIGVQSFDPGMLEKLGRIHGRREAIAAAESAHAAGFDSFNLDLMFGLPAQTPAQARADLATAMDLEPGHLSWYQLTIEPNTLFHHRPPPLPDDDSLWLIQEQGHQLLQHRGYTRYEVSAYARDGHQCRHNLNYWRFGDYLGIGAGAHGKLTDAAQQQIVRRWKPRQPQDYLAATRQADALGESRVLEADDAVLEYMMNTLRLAEGFSRGQFEASTGLDFSLAEAPVSEALERGLLENFTAHDGPAWRPTAQGQRFLNDLLGLFLPDKETTDAGNPTR